MKRKNVWNKSAVLDQWTFLKTRCLHYPQCKLRMPLGDITGDKITQRPQKVLYYFFHICSNTPQDLQTQFNL